MPTNGDDTLIGTPGNDSIVALAGNDSVDGAGGNDTLIGGAGNDTLEGSGGNDLIWDYDGTNVFRGGDGDDTIWVAGTGGIIETGLGLDSAIIWSFGTGRFVFTDFSPGLDAVDVNGSGLPAVSQTSGLDLDGDGSADDTRWSAGAITVDLLNYVPALISNPSGYARVSGTPFDDTIQGSDIGETIFGGSSSGRDWIDGGGGNDLISANGGSTLRGGSGDDTITSAPNGTTFVGGAGRDSIVFGPWFVTSGSSPTIIGFVAGEDSLSVSSLLNSVTMGLDVDGDGLFDDALAYGTPQAPIVFIDPVVTPIVGGTGHDLITGSFFDDTLFGGGGNDTLFGGTGTNMMSGGAGADVFDLSGVASTAVLIDYDPQSDRIIATPTYSATGLDLDSDGQFDDGWFGSSTLAVAVLNLNLPPVTGSTGADSLTGTVFGDTVSGAGGHDTIDGAIGNDLLGGDDGDDLLVGDQGDDTLNGGLGADRLAGGAGANLLSGHEGNDTFFVKFGNDTVFGGAGKDSVQVGDLYTSQSEPGGVALVIAGDDDDAIYIARGRATIDGGAGNDLIQYGLRTTDGEGNTYVWPRTYDSFDVTVNGGPGDDRLGVVDRGVSSFVNFATGQLALGTQGTFTFSNIEIIELNGATALGDTVIGWTGLKEARLGRGSDWVADYSSANNDRFFGEDGDDALWGLGGNDLLDGDWGNDTIVGGDGDDTLIGGDGGDWMHGGTGADVFRYLAVNDARLTGPLDIAAGFEFGIDKLDLAAIDANTSLAGDQAFTPGALQAGFAGRLDIMLAANLPGNEQLWAVRGDINGDGAADFQIWVVSGSGALTSGDFIL